MNSVSQGIRVLAKRPGFTAAAVLVLALGIGANTAIFSLVNAFLLKPLMVHKPEELVGLYSRDARKPDKYRANSPTPTSSTFAGRPAFSRAWRSIICRWWA